MKKSSFFTKNILDITSCGCVLRQRRIDLGKSLKEASQELKIGEQYLRFLEEESFGSIPGILYVKRFMRAYSDWLGIPDAYVVFENRLAEKPRQDRVLIQKLSSKDLMVFPRMFRYGMMFAGCFVVVGYILFQAYHFLLPPEVNLAPSIPITHNKEIRVVGEAQNTRTLFVNGVEVPVVNGRFETVVTLVSGLNSVSLRAFNRAEKETFSTVSVYYAKIKTSTERQLSLR